LALASWADLKTIMGVSLKGKVPDTTLLFEKGARVPDVFKSGGATMASRKAKTLFEEAGVKAEFFPIRLKFKDGRPECRYYFVNVVEVVDCVDWQRSDIVMDDRFPIVRKIDKLVLTVSAAPLFRPKGLEFLLCCSSDLAASINETRCTGLGFYSVDEYTFPTPSPESNEYQWAE